jgi:hypothetical protein
METAPPILQSLNFLTSRWERTGLALSRGFFAKWPDHGTFGTIGVDEGAMAKPAARTAIVAYA